VPKLVWRVKPVTELQAGETTEVEVARLERDEQAGLADLGLGLAEAKRLTAAIQAEIVPAQVTIASENRRTCLACGRVLASKGHYIPDRLVLLCHFLIYRPLLLAQAAWTPGQRFDQPDGKLAADSRNRVRHVPLRAHRQRPAAGSLRVAQVLRSACG
jgi:hypothetical protein